ncbi:MAG: 5'-nucleotidase C-terminal domain-containing protein [Thermodesulfobacteriota bacterium]|jgi:2',3'-cyclic-nucleotide 2'-phosphodiesterase (5'-nucleotidase family)
MKRLNTTICCVFLFFLFATFAYAQSSEIRILHVNDFHGFVEPYKPLGSDELLGGIPYLASKANELRKEKPSLLLSAGDMIQGDNWANLFLAESVIELMNGMRFDVMVLGNHEFDFGQGVLKKRISEARFPILGANVEGLDSIKPYAIKELKGIRVALIGIVTEDVPLATHPRNVAGLRFISHIETAEKYIKELKNKTDVIIVLSHIGYPADRVLAEKVKGIDVIVGGHSHTKITKPVSIGKTLIVQAWEHGKALGVLDLTVKDGKIIKFEGHLEEIKPEKGKEDKAALAIVKKYKERVNAVLNERIGEAAVDLDGENVRKRETNLGDFIADIMRRASEADVTLINGGGIRTSIKKGEVRMKEIYSALPFDNYIVAIKLTGKQIKEALEHGVSGVENEEGRFPQVSGLTFKYSPPEKRGSRVKEVYIAGKPIDPDRTYIVATNDFLAVGGDGYKAFGEAIKSSRDFPAIGGMMKGEKVVYSDSSRWVRDVVVEYIKEKKRIAPAMEGRIIEIR